MQNEVGLEEQRPSALIVCPVAVVMPSGPGEHQVLGHPAVTGLCCLPRASRTLGPRQGLWRQLKEAWVPSGGPSPAALSPSATQPQLSPTHSLTLSLGQARACSGGSPSCPDVPSGFCRRSPFPPLEASSGHQPLPSRGVPRHRSRAILFS